MGKRKKQGKVGPNGKQQRIAAEIRKDIFRGVYKPGDKLPPRAEVEVMYDCGPITVQNAFNKLKEDNSVTINPNQGTYVSETAPCLKNYAIILPFSYYALNHEVSFYSTLSNIASQYEDKDKNSLVIYAGLNGHEDEPDYIRLYDDVVSERLAGVIFATPPHDINHTPLYKEIMSRKYLPKVAFMEKNNPYPEIPTIVAEGTVLNRIFDYLEEKNIKRLAVLGALSDSPEVSGEKNIIAEAKKRGIDLPPYHFQARYYSYGIRSRELVQLMLRGASSERPQALWITNDTLVEGATLGVLDAGIKVPEELLVISHCNFPENPKSSVDTSWYGLNVLTFIDKALTSMIKYKKTGKIDKHQTIPEEYYLN